MEPLSTDLNSTLSLTEEESSIVNLPDFPSHQPTSRSPHVLLARVLTGNTIYKPHFYEQMSSHWKGRFPAIITDYNSDIFHISFGCEGDKRRVLNKEPWHFQNHLIILYTPGVLQNVTKEDMIFTSFWVQIYRLPFLSKTKALAEALGNIIGEFIEVFEDSTNEGWGPFLRVRVKLSVAKPLPRGQMIKLPKVKDEFWIDYRYERIPEFCFECGCLGHPFEQCIAFMERIDSGNDDDLPYGPWLKGARLPANNYDRYRTDFSKGNVWPLTTRLARRALTATLPTLSSRSSPAPAFLFEGESSTPMQPLQTPSHSSVRPNLISPSTNPTIISHSAPPTTTHPLNPPTITPVHCRPASSNFSNGLEVARIGLSGGIMLLWSDEIDVTLLNMGPTFFDCYMKFDGSPSFHFTGFYGAPDLASKSASWTLFQRFGDVAPLLPWLAIGDFNEILSNNDKSGGSLRRESHMDAFRTSLDKCFLQEVPYNGDPFTWTKNRATPHGLKERLDWCFINNKWSSHFHLPTVDHLDYFSSDHRALAVSFSFLSQTETPARSKSRFRFEKLWLADPESAEIIMKSWNSSFISDPITTVLDNLSTCATNLQSWHIGKYGKMKKNINSLQSKVADLNNSNSSSSDHYQELHNAETVLEDLLEQEEVYWQQRSRVDWLSCGDRNTKFFHAKASSRKSNNKIKFLHNSLGQKVYSKGDIAAVVQAFYSDLFSSASVDEEALNSTLSCIPTTVSAELNASLVKPFTPDEVYTALHSMGPDKSPGIDGMSAMFYQKNWTIVGDLVTKVVLSILNDNADPTALNKTLITLIPKVKKPQHIQEYRPISLCNVISKLVTKVLVSRFKLALPLVISEEQSAFLPNRLITDNVLVAFELVHAIKNKTAGRNGVASFKLDMSKAFDRVEWKFIEEVMRKMGFAERWISLIMSCLTTNNFSFIINGEVMGNLTPSRGLRQGCPLSPYLFLICSEGFSRLLQHEQDSNNLMGFKLTRHAPPITHLFFADDSLLFCQANERSCLAIKRVLDTYHKASGQELNLDKSVMSFSPNTTLAAQVFFHQQLSMPICECHEKYLGLPSYSGRDKKEMFSNIKERIWKLMNSWNEKIFSAGGKEILLKAVVQSIPTYAMSCFRLPAYFCKQVESMMANFWWGLTENGSRIHWRSWNLLCKSKLEGGMGFRSFIHFNQALLAKQAWRIFEKPHSLLGRILKSRYFPNNNFLEASLGHSPSLTWQGIHWARELLIKGLRWKVGDGRHIQSGSDPWIPGHNTFLPFHYSGPSNGVVSNLITDERQWDLPLLKQFFSALDVERILSVPLSFFSSRDVLIWHHHSSGLYTVKSGYHLAADMDIIDQSSSSNRDSHWWKFFWSLQLPPKVKIFAWRAIHDALPVATSLVKRKVITDSTCSVCQQAWESVGHALFSCKYAKAVWRHSNLVFDWRLSAAMYKGDYILHLSTIYSKAEMEQIFCSLWTIWTERNRIVHGHKARPAKDLASYAVTYLLNYRNAQQRVRLNDLTTCTSRPPQEILYSFFYQIASASPKPQVVPAAQQWRPPEANSYKLNVDAAIDVHQKVIGIGAIIRDSNGNVVAAYSKQQPGHFSSHEMEAIALFQSLNWVIQQQLPISLVESDALMVVNALRAPFNSISSFHDLIVDVLCLLSFLPDVTITHVKREANMAAHCLAKFALGVDEACSWFEEIPPPIYSVIRVENCLSKVEQSPSESMQSALSPSLKSLVDETLLGHTNVDVKVAVASCISEITRITAPDAPYDDDQMKEVFRLIVSSFENLCDKSSRSYTKRTSILETVAKVRSCVVMLDLECDTLILEMFQHFLNAISLGLLLTLLDPLFVGAAPLRLAPGVSRAMMEEPKLLRVHAEQIRRQMQEVAAGITELLLLSMMPCSLFKEKYLPLISILNLWYSSFFISIFFCKDLPFLDLS
uniref:Reverse transcriptase domain-containing protein n=1 Tax=Cannabis sativa TaxID=3483 RepID=A0A803QC75_CANSA